MTMKLKELEFFVELYIFLKFNPTIKKSTKK